MNAREMVPSDMILFGCLRFGQKRATRKQKNRVTRRSPG